MAMPGEAREMPGETAEGNPGLVVPLRRRARARVREGEGEALQGSAASAADGVGVRTHEMLANAQLPTFRQAQRRHHECAGHYGHPVPRGLRLAYGYGHMTLIKPLLNYTEWATDSPLRGTIHVLLALVIWLGLLAGGYL